LLFGAAQPVLPREQDQLRESEIVELADSRGQSGHALVDGAVEAAEAAALSAFLGLPRCEHLLKHGAVVDVVELSDAAAVDLQKFGCTRRFVDEPVERPRTFGWLGPGEKSPARTYQNGISQQTGKPA